MARKEVPEDEGPSQEWLASYADAMTLLLAFFIMMFAFALIDEAKYFDFKVGVTAALGVPDPLTDNTDSILAKGTGITPEVGLTPLTPSDAQELAEEDLRDKIQEAGTITAEEADDLAEYLELKFELAGAAEYVDVGVDERGVFIRFDGRVLFESGEAELDDDGLILLATAADILSLIDNPLEVEGHTDNEPTNGGVWPSNWELSTARASRVVRWLIDSGELPPLRLSALGRADTRPRASNNTPEGRQQNRRVEIVTRVSDMPNPDELLLEDGDGDGEELDIERAELGETDRQSGGAAGGDGADEPADTGDGDGDGGDGGGGDGVVAEPGDRDAAGDDSGSESPVDIVDGLDDLSTLDPIGNPTGDPLNPNP